MISDRAVFIGFIVFVCLIVGGFICSQFYWTNTNQKFGVINITEKYPLGIESCGRYGCVYVDPKIITESGRLFTVPKLIEYQVWAPMKIGHTYCVNYVGNQIYNQELCDGRNTTL